MFKNYFKIAGRSLWKNKVFSILNIIGLTVAFSVAILLTMHALHQLSYDKFHKNADKLYQANITWQIPKGTEVGTSQPTPLAEALKEEVPGIENITRVYYENAFTLYGDKEINLDALYVDDDFFDMFSFPIVKGKKKGSLSDISSAVISEETANKLFGEENPVGKSIAILIDGKQEPFVVSGVSVDSPDASSISYDIALHFENNPAYEDTKDRWGAQYHEVYIQLEDEVTTDVFEKNSRDFTNRHYANAIEGLKRDGASPNIHGNYLQFGLLPITDLRFVSYDKGYVEVSRAKVNMILGVILLIIVIACVNFVNMSIAKSSKRLREIGVRKTLGAKKTQLFIQFWMESAILFIISIGIGALLSYLLFDSFRTLFRTSATFEILNSPELIIGAFIGVVLVSILVASYPAILLNRLSAVQTLKGKLESSGSNRFQNALIVIQFGIAILLIGGTLVINGQLKYMQNKDLGYNKHQVFSFPLTGSKNSYDVIKLLRESLADNPNVLSVTGSDNTLGRGKDGSQYTSVWGFDYKGKGVKTNVLTVDYDYVKTLDLQLVSGRDFDAAKAGDTQSVIINESMAKELGEDNPMVAKIPVSDTLGYSVIGVVKDYHFQNISKVIEPLTFMLDRESGLMYAYVNVSPSSMLETVKNIEDTYKTIEPNAEFLGSFLDENVDRTFRREKNMAKLISSGSIIAILLCCVGLFAMSMFITNQRTKEIGIRKVVGASISSISLLLTKDFIKLVGIAFLIATPFTWWATSKWLENYPYRIELSIWFFISAGLLALLIAIITITQRTLSAAMANPVKSLRSE